MKNIKEYFAPLKEHKQIARISAETHIDLELLKKRIDTYVTEAIFGYKIIEPYLKKDIRILECGGGWMLLQSYLKSIGYNVVALEPLGKGFDFFCTAKPQLLDCLGNSDINVFDIGIEELDYKIHGEFDLIFSINVLEHVDHLDLAFNKMSVVLSKNGTMIHHCPNYFIPYEPHFSIPLIPFLPEKTKYLFKNKINANQPLWESLNFITYRKLEKLVNKNSLSIEYQKGILYESFKRLDDKNSEFSKRHNKYIKSLYWLLKYSGILGVLKHTPGKYLTPITFTLKK
jgi:SAM-dependent methyltransferase